MKQRDRSRVHEIPSHSPVSYDAALGWIDGTLPRLSLELVPIEEAGGRVLAEDCRADRAIPDGDRAALDGFAVQAQQTVGAGAYNPLSLAAVALAAGDPLPADLDAVVPLDHAEEDGRGGVLVVEPVTPGANVTRHGAVATPGAMLVPGGTLLAARHLGMLAMAGIGAAPVVRQPRVELLLVGPAPSQGTPDGNGPMLRAAVARDGGVVAARTTVRRARADVAAALGATKADIVLAVGGTGRGSENHAAAALAEAGGLEFHGIALQPGETTGLGHTGQDVPVLLLPGAPAACLWSYEMLAGRAIRRLGGRDPALPYPRRMMTLARKLASSIGMTEICPVRRGGATDTIEPLPSFAEIGLMAASVGDGFVIIPETSEGYPQGATVAVFLYEGR